MAILDRDAILGASDLKRETVAVPEWGGDVIVRAMTGEERDEFESVVFGEGKRDMRNLRARLVAMTLIDEKGKRLFSEDDVQKLAGKSSAALTRVFIVAQKLNGLGADEQEKLGNA